MRQITKQAVNAFYNWENFSLSNTFVDTHNGENRMFLHGNLIAKCNNWVLEISSAGWETTTTKERLNGILGAMWYSVKQKKYTWYIYDHHTKELIPFNEFNIGHIKTF